MCASLDDITDALNVFNKQNQVRKARQQALDEIECDFLNAVDEACSSYLCSFSP